MNKENKEFFINDVEAENLTLEENKPSTSKVLYEDTSKRGKNIKHFRLQNGNFMAVMYDHPIHKLDPDTGKYVDIAAEVTETDTDYETVMGHFKVCLPKTEGKDSFVTVEKDGREISWKFVPRNASRRKKYVAAFSRRPKQDLWDIGYHPSVKYEKADTNTDLQYDIFDDGVKESIILAKKPECNTFSFELKLKGLVPMLSDDKKTVLLISDNEGLGSKLPEMKIPPAFMEDTNNAICNDIHYEIRHAKNTTYLDIVLETDWLSDPERSYPVIIDPRVELLKNTWDNKIDMVEVCSDGTAITPMDYCGINTIGIDSSANIHRLYINFELPELADGYKLTQAGMIFHQFNYATNCKTPVYDYIVASATNPYEGERELDLHKWDDVKLLNIGSTIGYLLSNYNGADDEIKIDLTKQMIDWYDKNNTFVAKRCLVIKKINETPTYNDGTCSPSYLQFYSTNTSSSTHQYRPMFYIEYTSEDMYADHQKYHTFETGRAGTGSINLFTGKMSFAHGDVSTEGVKLPLSIAHLYRFEYVEKDADGNIIPTKYGIGWKLSAEQRLDVVREHGITAVYTNAQGKRHYFMSHEANDTGEIPDDAGLGLTYKECNWNYGYDIRYVLKDEKGNQMGFDESGKLIHIIDTNGHISKLEYSENNLIRVTDGSRLTATLHYTEEDNKLCKITDSNNRNILYDYDASGNLISITYPSPENSSIESNLKTEFSYDNKHHLIKILDYSGIAYSIEYDENNKVSKILSSGSKNVENNLITATEPESSDSSVSFEYRLTSTAVVDNRSKIKTVYKFDINGREEIAYQDMTEIVDKSKINESTMTEICGYTSITDSSENQKTGKYRSLSVSMNNDSADEENFIQDGFFSEIDSSDDSPWEIIRGDGVSTTNYIDGKNSYHFSGSSLTQYISQEVNLCNKNFKGNILVASAWAKATGNVNANSEGSNAKFRLCLNITYEDGSTSEIYGNYDTGYNGWQYVAVPFDLNSEKIPVSATVKLDYSCNYGGCYFTNVRLVAVNGISTTNAYRNSESPVKHITVFGAPKNIKLISTKKDSVLTTVDYTDDNSDVVRTTIIDKNNREFTTDYMYDSKHNLIKTQDYRGLVIEYTYNQYGKELTRKTYHKDNPNLYMFSEYTYQDGNFITSERDSRYAFAGEELKTTYEHDTSRNLLLKQTSVSGQEYNYSYDNTTDDLRSLSSTTNGNTNQNEFFYTLGYLTKVAHNDFNFGFSYDKFGRSKSVTVGDNAVTTTLLSMTYSKSGINNINDVVTTEYASNEKNTVTTDIFGNPIVSTYTDKNNVERIISNATYDSVGKVKQLVDNERGVCYNYTYDAKGNITKIVETDKATGEVLATNTFVFDANERLTSKTYGAVGHTYRPVYEKNENGYIYPDNEILGITLDGKFTDKVTKDGFRRVNAKTFQIGSRTLFSESYGYLSTPKDGKTIATEIVSSVESHVYGPYADAENLLYTYDRAGNLETVSRGSAPLLKYYYDGLNRLKREDNYTAEKTYVWDYDEGGNIQSKQEYDLSLDINLGTCLNTKEYDYRKSGWRDQLISFNGEACVYDALGNPTTYRGKSLEWTKVRRLSKFDNNTFEYGASGIRYRKNNIVYTLDGNKILRESDGIKTLTYYYGGSGIIGFEYNGTDYYFRKNLQGDVTEIYTSEGFKVASYTYDAWGKVLSVNNYTADNIGDLNPIRYRSYYYDVETGLYYLQSRYYDPETGRFINADTTSVLEDAMYDINGLNLYAYCDNNPVAGRDDEGDASFWKKLAVAVAVVAVVAVVAAAVAVPGGAFCAAATVLMGAAKGAVIGAAVGAATGAVVGGVQGAVEGYKETGNLDGTLRAMGKGAMKGAVQGAADGFVSGLMMGGISTGITTIANGYGTFCFVAGTTVLTTLGNKAIETIEIGDTVPCVDHITGEFSEKKVVTTTVNKVNRLIELDIDGEIIQCTETHPFQVKGKGWVDACNLNPGDIIYTKDWNTTTVKSVNLLEFDEPVEVFNFEVEDFHTYFVGNCGILVHNALCHELGKAGEKAAGIEKNTKTISMNGRNRIPDGYNPNMWVQEVKNVNSQSLTSQLKDDFIFASQNKLKMELYVRQTTHLTKPLQNAIKTFGVIVRYLP